MYLWDIIAALLFLGSSGLLFQQRFRENVPLVIVAGVIALVATYYLTRDVARDIAIEVFREETRGTHTALPEKPPSVPDQISSSSQLVAPSPYAPAVADALDRARSVERDAQKTAAEAREAERRSGAAAGRAREAAQQARAGAAGFATWDGKTRTGLGKHFEGQVSSDGVWNGYGVNTYANGDRYEGEFRAGAMSGIGIFLYANGERSFGELRDNQSNGATVYVWTGGDRYEGEFHDDNIGGTGVLYGGSSVSYHRKVGQFANNMLNGYGAIYWKDGTSDIGSWTDDRLNGYGAKLDANGKIVAQGYYEKGVLKTAMTP